MSVKTVRRFLHKAEKAPDLQRKLQAIPKGGGQWTVAEVVKLAEREDFRFTAQDYEDAVNDILAEQHAAGALNEAEIALIAGGIMCISSDGTSCKCCKVQTPSPGTTHP
jgi:hypothetical protein